MIPAAPTHNHCDSSNLIQQRSSRWTPNKQVLLVRIAFYHRLALGRPGNRRRQSVWRFGRNAAPGRPEASAVKYAKIVTINDPHLRAHHGRRRQVLGRELQWAVGQRFEIASSLPVDAIGLTSSVIDLAAMASGPARCTRKAAYGVGDLTGTEGATTALRTQATCRWSRPASPDSPCPSQPETITSVLYWQTAGRPVGATTTTANWAMAVRSPGQRPVWSRAWRVRLSRHGRPGRDHALTLLQNGQVQCWGGNREGQVGDGTTQNRYTPVTVTRHRRDRRADRHRV